VRYFAVTRRQKQLVTEGVVPKVGPRTFGRCKLLRDQHFESSLQLALGAGGRRFESGRPDHFSTYVPGRTDLRGGTGVTPGTRHGQVAGHGDDYSAVSRRDLATSPSLSIVR